MHCHFFPSANDLIVPGSRINGVFFFIVQLLSNLLAFHILQVVMAGSFYPNYFTYGPSDQESAVRELGGKDPKTTIVVCSGASIM